MKILRINRYLTKTGEIDPFDGAFGIDAIEAYNDRIMEPDTECLVIVKEDSHGHYSSIEFTIDDHRYKGRYRIVGGWPWPGNRALRFMITDINAISPVP